jgi:metal-responsive CopG/Arc/MetJ family transcriptional regulator
MATPKLPPMTVITVRIPTSLLKNLGKYAKDRKKTRSIVIREWIEDGLADNGYYSS